MHAYTLCNATFAQSCVPSTFHCQDRQGSYFCQSLGYSMINIHGSNFMVYHLSSKKPYLQSTYLLGVCKQTSMTLVHSMSTPILY